MLLFPRHWLGPLCALVLSAAAAGAPAYVPAPQPVNTGRYRVGAALCPLWAGGQRWREIQPFADRKPLLGWYDEGNPEVTDWEIKWAVDHGISFFMVCWYREPSGAGDPAVRPGLEHWIRNGLFHARYGNQVQFGILWDNANREYFGKTSAEDFLGNLLPFWIHDYFSRPNYLSLDGCPVFSIFKPDKFIEDLGGEEQTAAVLAKAREICRQAGFKNVVMLGQNCWGNPAELRRKAEQIRRVGFDATWAYHWPTFTGAFAGDLHPSGAKAIAAQEAVWQAQLQPNPITLSMGWDEAPWHFRYSHAQWRLNPEEFETLCARAKDFLDRRPGDGIEHRLVFLDNWNEFGEGHYICPTQGAGFGYLDAVREVFAPSAGPHTDLTPSEVGLGPYDSAYRALHL